MRALVRLTVDDSLAQHRIYRKLCHPPAQSRQLRLMIQRPQRIKQLETLNNRVRRGFIQKVEIQHIIDPE